MTQNTVLENLDEPELLEKAYHDSPREFEAQVNEALETNKDSETLRVWNARLSYVPPASLQKIALSTLFIICLIAFAIVKIPTFLDIDDSWFYARFIPVTIIGSLIAYYLITSDSSSAVVRFVIMGLLAITLYLAFFPEGTSSDSIVMAVLHAPFLLLSLLAISFMGDDWKNVEPRLNFIRYLGELGVNSILILLGGMVLTGVTLGLFEVIGLNIKNWYFGNVVVLGLVSAPVVATYLYDSVQKRQGKFASLLANVFSPLFLVTVLAYLLATLYLGKNPYTDRNFLIIINGLLVVILALTIFSISGKKGTSGVAKSDYINMMLIGATLLVNVIALSAILFRWVEHGTTVNRKIVTGANVLIFFHLILLLKEYLGYIFRGSSLDRLEATIANYLPLYTIWTFIVVVVLPIKYGFK